MTGRGFEKMTPHTGTGTLPRLLREAADRNLPQWAKSLTEQYCVSDEVLRDVKLFSEGKLPIVPQE